MSCAWNIFVNSRHLEKHPTNPVVHVLWTADAIGPQYQNNLSERSSWRYLPHVMIRRLTGTAYNVPKKLSCLCTHTRCCQIFSTNATQSISNKVRFIEKMLQKSANRRLFESKKPKKLKQSISMCYTLLSRRHILLAALLRGFIYNIPANSSSVFLHTLSMPPVSVSDNSS